MQKTLATKHKHREKLVVGRKVEDVIALLKGVQCRNGTSCPDQLARALEAETHA